MISPFHSQSPCPRDENLRLRCLPAKRLGIAIALCTALFAAPQVAAQDPATEAEATAEAEAPASESTPVVPVIDAEVRKVLTPALTRLRNAEQLRATIKMTVTSSIGDKVLGQNEGLFQLASKAPNQFSLSAKFDTEAVQFICDGQNLFIKMSASEYIDLPAPEGFAQLIAAMPIQLGPQPEPMLWLSLAGVNPVGPLMTGLQSCQVVAIPPQVAALIEAEQQETKTVEAIRPEGLKWRLTVSTGATARPINLQIDMTEMIKQTNNLQVPEGYSFLINYDFERWDVNQTLPEGIFEFTPAEGAERFESLADYLIRDGAMANHPLLGLPAPEFTARQFEGDEVVFDRTGDEVLVLDFWATWCAPCVEALPEMQALAEKFSEKPVRFYAVNVSEMPDAIKGFLETHELSIPVLVDVEGQLTRAYAATAIPQTVLIGKDGRVEAVHVGFDSNDSMKILEQEIETLLAGRRIYQAEEVSEEVPAENSTDATATDNGKSNQ
jgi:thiol-disulfide isomerase/thioredoxin